MAFERRATDGYAARPIHVRKRRGRPPTFHQPDSGRAEAQAERVRPLDARQLQEGQQV